MHLLLCAPKQGCVLTAPTSLGKEKTLCGYQYSVFLSLIESQLCAYQPRTKGSCKLPSTAVTPVCGEAQAGFLTACPETEDVSLLTITVE